MEGVVTSTHVKPKLPEHSGTTSKVKVCSTKAGGEGGPEYSEWPEDAMDEGDAGQSAGNSLCDGLALTIDAILLAWSPKPKQPDISGKGGAENKRSGENWDTPSQALLKVREFGCRVALVDITDENE
jgi:hypothetical protein